MYAYCVAYQDGSCILKVPRLPLSWQPCRPAVQLCNLGIDSYEREDFACFGQSILADHMYSMGRQLEKLDSVAEPTSANTAVHKRVLQYPAKTVFPPPL